MKSLESKNLNAQKVACFQEFVLTEFLNWDRINQMASEFLSNSELRSEKGESRVIPQEYTKNSNQNSYQKCS